MTRRKFVNPTKILNSFSGGKSFEKVQMKNRIIVLEERENYLHQLLDKHKIPNRIVVLKQTPKHPEITAGITTFGRVELLIKKLSKKK